ISKSSWLGELENISIGHGVSLLRWRSGGVEHPHDTPPYPFLPSPTFAHSSKKRGVDDVIKRDDEHRVTIGRCLRCPGPSNIAAGAADILHVELLSEILRKLLYDQSGNSVGSTAGR